MATKTPAPEINDTADAPADTPSEGPRKHPTKGNRYRVLPGEGGDVLIVSVVGKDDPRMPPGAMLLIESVPRFETATEARKWLNNSGDLLAGMQLMIIHCKAMGHAQVETKPQVRIAWAPRTRVAGPVGADAP